MAASRESINRIKIEDFRISKVAIDPATTIYQGDQLCWNDTEHRAEPHTAASGAQFFGIAEGQNPIPTAGVLTSDLTAARINVIQKGMVELIVDEAATFYHGDLLTLGTTSVQHVKKTGATTANCTGVVADENNFGEDGKALVVGDVILLWLKVPSRYVRN